jgi:hypothetical protein
LTGEGHHSYSIRRERRVFDEIDFTDNGATTYGLRRAGFQRDENGRFKNNGRNHLKQKLRLNDAPPREARK